MEADKEQRMRLKGRNKEIAQLARLAHENGWRVEPTKGRTGNHLAWFSPDGASRIISASTPSDYRAVRNLRSRLRRAGLANA